MERGAAEFEAEMERVAELAATDERGVAFLREQALAGAAILPSGEVISQADLKPAPVSIREAKDAVQRQRIARERGVPVDDVELPKAKAPPKKKAKRKGAAASRKKNR